MVIFILLFLLGITLGLFVLPKLWKYPLTLLSGFVIAGISLTFAIPALFYGITYSESFVFPFWQAEIKIQIDALSAFFILLIDITCISGIIYAGNYLNSYLQQTENHAFGLHFTSLIWLQATMLGVTMLDGSLMFLIVWELMSLSSFLLVIFDGQKKEVLKAGINYMIQMHIGFFLLLTAFLFLESKTGSMSFESLTTYFTTHRNFWLFYLFFIGFGIKAGFMPFHSWLPKAHPAAPSHVSGIMSAGMIKIGIYGILRVLTFVQQDMLIIGIFIFCMGMLSGLLGIMQALMQHDMKKLLAYSSIENIGIIGIGIGLAIIGKAVNQPILSLLGMLGALLHILNHSLYKSVLFYSSGIIYQAVHTRNIEQMGGLWHKMPKTGWVVLFSSLAICALPPFNGFISEYLIYVGLFKGIAANNLPMLFTLLLGIIVMALIGGLSLMTFIKFFAITFLGRARSEKVEHVTETRGNIHILFWIILALMLILGIFPILILPTLTSLIQDGFGIQHPEIITIGKDMSHIGILGGIFLLLFALIWFIRKVRVQQLPQKSGPVWGCGYTGSNEKMQYTASGFVQDFLQIARPILRYKRVMNPISEEEIFPHKRSFTTTGKDALAKEFIEKPATFLQKILYKLAILQTGQLQHYVLYAFLFMILTLVLTVLNLI